MLFISSNLIAQAMSACISRPGRGASIIGNMRYGVAGLVACLIANLSNSNHIFLAIYFIIAGISILLLISRQ